ncbi:MAG TPA: GTPase Era [Myxococcaceae bacterium]
MTRAGFAALIGRPNVGKSTLLNRLTGEKLAIVSPKPQTTRHRIMGVVTLERGQVALLDTPGIHEAKGALNRRMVEVALQAAGEVDVVCLIIEAASDSKPEVGPGNERILEELKRLRKPVVLAINKIDTVQKPLLLPLIALYQERFPFAEVIPISARSGDGVDALLELILELLPEGELMFDPDTLTDQAERALVAEYVREQVLKHCRQEIPYSSAVRVDIFEERERERGLVKLECSILVERESQKAIVIGKRGAMLKAIGTDARKSIERLLGTRVFLSLRVRVEEDWTDSPQALRKLGYA